MAVMLIAEHHALIACTANLIAGSHRNIGGLLVDGHHNLAGIGIKARCPAGVADVTQDPPGNALNIHIDLARDLACNEHRVGGAAGLTGHPALRVLRQHCIQHRIRDTVAHLVGMALCHRLRRKQLSHTFSSSAFFLSSCSWRHTAAACRSLISSSRRTLTITGFSLWTENETVPRV